MLEVEANLSRPRLRPNLTSLPDIRLINMIVE